MTDNALNLVYHYNEPAPVLLGRCNKPNCYICDAVEAAGLLKPPEVAPSNPPPQEPPRMALAEAKKTSARWDRSKSRTPRVFDYLNERYGTQCVLCTVKKLPYVGRGAYGIVHQVQRRIAIKYTGRDDDRGMAAWDQWLRARNLPSPFVPVYEWYVAGKYSTCDECGNSTDIYVKQFARDTGKRFNSFHSTFDMVFGAGVGDAHGNNFANYGPACTVNPHPGYTGPYSALFDCFIKHGPAPEHYTQERLDRYKRKLGETGILFDYDKFDFTIKEEFKNG